MSGKSFRIPLIGALLAFGFSTAPGAIPKTVTFTAFLTGTTQLPLNKPIFFAEIPGKPGYYAILEQHLGQVSVVYKVNGTWTKAVMDTVVFGPGVTSQNSSGLLGMAFHPNFAQNHKYYLNYTPTYSATEPQGRSYIVERQTDASLIKRNTAVASRILLDVISPYANHKAGSIGFGPKDGFLYVSTGDGGPESGQDPGNRAQNLDSLHGKMLRIDPDHPANGKQYGIPADNPYAGTAHAQEIFAVGLRNPFRWSFDPLTGNIWLGHVGQNNWESATLVPKGANLGWRVLEGSHCNPQYGTTCSFTGYYLPFFTYPNNGTGDTTGNCIIGGYVYRGNPASAFYGLYFMGDNGNSRVWAIRRDSVTNSKQEYALEGTLPASSGGLVSFGADLQGNLYAVGRGNNSTTGVNGVIYALGGPDLQPVTSVRRYGKAFAPLHGNGTGLALHSLQGRKVRGAGLRSGLYVTKRPDGAAALVPVLK